MKSRIENPSKSEVIGRCGGDEKNEWPRRSDKSRTLKNTKKQQQDLAIPSAWSSFTHLSY